jgi:hypothetical protein
LAATVCGLAGLLSVSAAWEPNAARTAAAMNVVLQSNRVLLPAEKECFIDLFSILERKVIWRRMN